jgi:hypothetical protein
MEQLPSGTMSNSKWVKLIDCLVKNAAIVKRTEFKRKPDGRIGTLSIDEDLIFEFDYWNVGFEGANSLGGWLEYKDIEWVRFPAGFQSKVGNLTQDLSKIESIINTLGQFNLYYDDDALILSLYI